MNAAPLGVGLFGAVTTASDLGEAGFTVAVNVRGLPEAPASVAVTVVDPTVVGRIQLESAATPLASVATVTGLATPPGPEIVPPAAAEKLTTTPGTLFPAASRTLTAGTCAA